MTKQISIKWNIVKFSLDSLDENLDFILSQKFWENISDLASIQSLYNPFLLKDMDRAVSRIKKAKDLWEKVFIFWDYDVDGVTSTSILMHFFMKIWIKASYRLPHRIADWYWLNFNVVNEALEKWVSLIVTVDCGTRDMEIIDYAKKNWVDVIVTDHHWVPEITPENSIAFINPKRKDCLYPYKHLSWAGVAFKLVQALASFYLKEEAYKKYILSSTDICAIWTVADCMPITWENKLIVALWLKQIKESRSRWIRILLDSYLDTDLDSDIFWFIIWPLLNAAWRMDSAFLAVNLILNNNDSVEKTLTELQWLNEKRKFLTKQFLEDFESNINTKDNIVFYMSKEIPHGIMWIVAGRITEKYYKPCIVLKDEWDSFVASCRSPDYFSMIDLLEKRKDVFSAFWWHKQAAGFSLDKDKFVDFKKDILFEMNKKDFSKYKKEIEITKLVNFDELGFNFLYKINNYKPFWIGNEKPIFMLNWFNEYKVEFLGNKTRDHLKFTTKYGFKIIAFYMWEYYEEIKVALKEGRDIFLIFDISQENWLWKKSLSLKVLDVVFN